MTQRRLPDPVDELDEDDGRLHSPYTRVAVEWIAVAAFAGIVLAVLGVAAAVVYWAWTA